MRSTIIRATVLCLFAATLILTYKQVGATQSEPAKWYKGNLHTHTANSDGDSTPTDVASWYKENRYHFLVLTDHNYLTEISGLNAVHGATEKFLLISGEEVSSSFANRPVHVNAFNPAHLVTPRKGDSMVDTIQQNLDAIREAKGLPSVNHPNFRWAMTSKDLLALRDLRLFEVYNGHPTVNNLGGGGFESLEEMWDTLLSAGRRVYGIAVDDAHHFKRLAKNLSNPGRGWVMVRAPRLTAEDITAALAAGEFYASTGVELKDVRNSAEELRLEINPAVDTLYRTQFIGDGGKVLAAETANTAVYRFRGNEKYVRARVVSSNGDEAWTQPVFRGN